MENMHDTPYLNGGLGAEVTACMTRVTSEVRRLVPRLALGVQVLSGELSAESIDTGTPFVPTAHARMISLTI